jgi:hypothetical protein
MADSHSLRHSLESDDDPVTFIREKILNLP